jgi:F0F1-type ATP synthase membrane subunit b/b'
VLWVLVDVAIGVLAVLLLIFVGFLGYRHVRVLMKAVSNASERVADASVDLNAQQATSARRSRTDVG